MIQVRYTECLKSLEQAALDMERKLVAMVTGFAGEMAWIITENTPVGDQEAIDRGEGKYYKFYKTRFDEFVIPMKVGYHQGSWRYSETGLIPFDTTIYVQEEAAIRVKQDLRGSYKLGDNFYIMSNGPGIMFLEDRNSPKAPMGIVTPSMAEIEASYKVNLKGYFDRA